MPCEKNSVDIHVDNSANDSHAGLIYNNVILNVTEPADVNTVASHLKKLAAASLKEPGCERFEVYHSETEPVVFMLIEQWLSQQMLDQHREATAFQSIYIPNVIPLVSRTPHICRLL